MSGHATAPSLPGADAPADEWLGRHLGERTVSWDDRDPILYALSLGASPEQLDLVFEDRLRVLPPFALTLAQWAPDVLGAAGAWDVGNALHGQQVLDVHRALPASGEIRMAARVTAVWDKGAAAVYDVTVESDAFTATWSIFAPGRGGFGGERGPGRPAETDAAPSWEAAMPLAENSAALYRLLGDRHHIHIDPAASTAIGQPKPILQGLATLAATTLVAAEQAGAHPADLTRLEGRFAAPVFPGETLRVCGWDAGAFTVASERGAALTAGLAVFA